MSFRTRIVERRERRTKACSMNTRRTDSRDEALSRLLRSWEVDRDAPLHMADDVWRRIAARGKADEEPWWKFSWAVWLRRPVLAFGYLGLIALLGAGTGAVRGRAAAESLSGELQGRYVMAIDPFAEPHR